MDPIKAAATIDEYIASQPEGVQERLHRIRAVIREAAPDATEKIAYQMPTFFLKGNLVHFAAFKKHIGFFPGGGELAPLQDEVARYRTGRGTLQFPLDQPVPYDLITKIVKVRVAENLAPKKKKVQP